MGLSRARGLAGQRGETERRCPRRRRRHRAINTARPAAAAAYAGRLRTVRGPRPGSGSARAAAPGRGPGRLQPCGDLAAGGSASRPRRSPPSCAAGRARPGQPAPARPGPLLQSRQMRPAGDDLGREGARAGRPAGFSLACQQLPSLPGGMDRLLKPSILQGTKGVPRREILRGLQTL